MGQHYIIREFDSFTSNVQIPGSSYTSLPEKTFNNLEMFILANRSNVETDAIELMTISSRRGIGKIISAKNYVGLITMNDGTQIEILPKIYSTKSIDEAMTRQIFLNMLETVKEIPYKKFTVSNVDAKHMNIFEVFIRMFIEEIFSILKGGLKATYLPTTENEKFLKGKIIFPQHIKNNYVHQEKFFVQYDIFDTNRPENRLIKSTIRLLHRKTTNIRNKRDLSVLLASFDGIDYSANYKNDFSQHIKNRNIKEYETAMSWCRVFLFNRSFTAFAGSEVAFALLFPMELLFESYVAAKLKQKLDKTSFSMTTQDKTYHLFDYPSKKFCIRPDIVIAKKADGSIKVLDTKWKLLSANVVNLGISQSDMYQMYAYSKKYEAKAAILLYPLNEAVKPIIDEPTYISKDGVTVKVMFIDLTDIDESISKVLL